MRKITAIFFIIFLISACGGDKQSENQQQDAPIEKQTETTDTQAQGADNVLAQGKTIYNKFCLVCHQANGSGVDGLYPPLVNTDWVKGDKERLIKIILNGQEGPIEVNGETYNNVMPAQDFLKNDEVAAVLTYIRQNFENNASAITAQEVEEVRQSL